MTQSLGYEGRFEMAQINSYKRNLGEFGQTWLVLGVF